MAPGMEEDYKHLAVKIVFLLSMNRHWYFNGISHKRSYGNYRNNTSLLADRILCLHLCASYFFLMIPSKAFICVFNKITIFPSIDLLLLFIIYTEHPK